MIADFATLCTLAATKRPKAVCAWLARNRIHYMLDTKGHPVTTLSAIDRALHRGRDENNEPNIEALLPCPSSTAGSAFRASPKNTADTTSSSATSGTRSP